MEPAATSDEKREDPSRPGHVPQREAPGEEKPHRRELTEYEPAPPAQPDPDPDRE